MRRHTQSKGHEEWRLPPCCSHSPQSCERGQGRPQGKGKDLGKVNVELRSDASESHVPIRCFLPSPRGWATAPPTPPTLTAGHTLYFPPGTHRSKNLRTGVPEVFLSWKPTLLCFHLPKATLSKGHKICLTSNTSRAGVRHNLCLETRVPLPTSLVAVHLLRSVNNCLLLCKVELCPQGIFRLKTDIKKSLLFKQGLLGPYKTKSPWLGPKEAIE